MSYHKHRDAIFRRYKGVCWVCGGFGSEIDHVVPRSLGGSDHKENLRPICSKCNKGRNRHDSPFSYSRLPKMERVVLAGEIKVYRGRVIIKPSMFAGGNRAVQRLKRAESKKSINDHNQQSSNYEASKVIVGISESHTKAAYEWIRNRKRLRDFLSADNDWSKGLTRRIFIVLNGPRIPVTGQVFLERRGWLSYTLNGAEVPADWNEFHHACCPVCDQRRG